MDTTEMIEEIATLHQYLGLLIFKIRNPMSTIRSNYLAQLEMQDLEKSVAKLKELYINSVKEAVA